MDDLEFIAYNIVNQIADYYSERIPSDQWVDVRQASNDELDAFVLGRLKHALATVEQKKTETGNPTQQAVPEPKPEPTTCWRCQHPTHKHRSCPVEWVEPDGWLIECGCIE